MYFLSLESVESPKVVWTGFHFLPWLAQNFEGVGGMSSLLILDVYGAYYELHGCTLYIEIYTQTGNGHVRPDQNDGKEDIQKLTSCPHV